jgi:hypothetical protein
MAHIREIELAQQALSQVESYIRGMSVPTQDRIWGRFRQEQALLTRLLDFDLQLVRDSEHIYRYVSQLLPETWKDQGSGELPRMTQQLARLARERERLLLLQL